MTARHLIRPEERRRPQPTDAELGEGSLSVVVPVYGSARILPLLHERLSTVLKSMNCPYEIIFVDDCGPGETWSVLKDLSARDPAVVAVQLMKNVGQSSATLCGLAHARGSTLITMDDDSEQYPTFQHPGTELLYMLEGKIEYRCGPDTYLLEPGDSLTFQGEVAHGPEKLVKFPIKFLSFIVYPRSAE